MATSSFDKKFEIKTEKEVKSFYKGIKESKKNGYIIKNSINNSIPKEEKEILKQLFSHYKN
ncbi:MAG: hypothetical protein WC002_06535 [Candidatus Muiribacteriota bacterium]